MRDYYQIWFSSKLLLVADNLPVSYRYLTDMLSVGILFFNFLCDYILFLVYHLSVSAMIVF